jgi:acetyl-CoA acetyltransferase
MITELALQLRGQAGPRQVQGAKTALLHNAGIGGVNVMLFKR